MAGPRVPAACQPGLERGVRGVSPRLKKRIEEALLPHSKGGPPLPEGRTPLTRRGALLRLTRHAQGEIQPRLLVFFQF